LLPVSVSAEYYGRPVGQAVIFCSCGFFLLSLFSSPILRGRRLDVYRTSTHDDGLSANLKCMSEMCCTQLAENTWRKIMQKNSYLRTIA